MSKSTEHHFGRPPPSRGVSSSDVERAADALLRSGERPTIERVRAALGGGSPNTINPHLDTWWRRLAARLDSGPAALHRLPESVAHVAEALWIQALDEGRRRAQLELQSGARGANEQKQTLDVRSHVLSLREGELDSRLRDRENAITQLNLQLRELTLLLRKEQATREALVKRITTLEKDFTTRATSPPLAPMRSGGERPSGRPRALRRGVKREALNKTELVLRQQTRRKKSPTMVPKRSKRVAKPRRVATNKARRKSHSPNRRR